MRQFIFTALAAIGLVLTFFQMPASTSSNPSHSSIQNEILN